jgi:hypothetical protein
LPVSRAYHAFIQAAKHSWKASGPSRAKTRSKVAGDPVGQIQEAFEPVLAFPAEQGDLLEVVGPGDDGADGDDQDRLKGMKFAAVEARILELAKMANQGKRLGHAHPP